MIEDIFGKSAQQTVLEHLLNTKDEMTYLSGIAKETGLSHSSVSRVLEPLLAKGIVDEQRIGKQVRTFRLNAEHPLSCIIVEFYEKLRRHEIG